MGFREHIFDLFAGPEIPVRHLMFLHDFLIIRCQALPFTDTFHNLERLFGFNPFVDQIDHNIISCTDSRGNLGFTFLNQCLRIAQPYIRTMGQTGDTHQIRKCFRFCITEHLHNEFRTELRNTKRTQVGTADVLRFDMERLKTMKQR